MVNSGELGKALLANVRASTPPHGDALAAQLRTAHDRLRSDQSRLLMTISQFAAPLVLVPAFYLSFPVFIGAVGATVVGAGRVALRSRRRSEEVRELARHARIAEARALRNGNPGDDVTAYETERFGNAYLRIEVPDGDRTFTARLVRERPRGFGQMSFDKITTLYAPHSSIVIAFDTRGEMILGTVESAQLPQARVV